MFFCTFITASTCNNVSSCSDFNDKNGKSEKYCNENPYNCYLNNSSKFNDGLYSLKFYKNINFYSVNFSYAGL